MSLPGLMMAISVSSGVLLISVSLLQLAREGFLHHHQSTALEDSATYGLQIISRTARQATRDRNLSPSAQPSGSLPFDPAQGSVQGIDNARISGAGTVISPGINGSDVLIIQLGSAWGEVIDCAGFVVTKESSSPGTTWVMIYTAPGPDGEPELYCRYQGQKQWDSQAIVSGVECFQVLFGLDQDDDGLPNQFLSASAIKQQQASLAPGDSMSGLRVVAVQVVLILRSATAGGKPPLFKTTDIFGNAYTHTNGENDMGTAHCPMSLSASLRSRARRRVDAFIFLPDRESPK